ncbi:MAG: hypothetical protein ABSC15_04475 [Terriglobales bacterium]
MRPLHVRVVSTLLMFSAAIPIALAQPNDAQIAPYERKFAQSKVVVEKVVKQLQASASGRLPVLDGFTRPGDLPLDRFQRGYYQCEIQVSSTSSGGALVRVSAKITAWYADPASSNSGYQVLPSNGRLENDFLDRLSDALHGSPAAAAPVVSTPSRTVVAPSQSKAPDAPMTAISAPMPSNALPAAPTASSKLPTASAISPFKPANSSDPDLATQKAVADKHMEELTKEAKGLEEILRNQARPKNLVAVKKSDTPVLVSPVEGAKVLFLATAEDEFEILDLNANWVHVRISGLSRGWIRRSALEVPESFTPDTKVENPQAAAPSTEPFQVKNEEIASFPGTWDPLRGQTVKIVTVQRANGSATSTSSQVKLEFAKSLFQKEYAELTQAPTSAAGVVVIFDSEDGGMAAATLLALREWKAGTLSDQAFWRRCFFDPPETFTSSTGQ